MSQDPPRRDPDLDDRTLAGRPGGLAGHDETRIGGLDMTAAELGTGTRSGADHEATGADTDRGARVPDASMTSAISATPARVPCPSCGQVPEGESRFCQACGQHLGTGPAEPPRAEAPGEPLRPWFYLVALAWIVVMVAAFYFIYANAFTIGSS